MCAHNLNTESGRYKNIERSQQIPVTAGCKVFKKKKRNVKKRRSKKLP